MKPVGAASVRASISLPPDIYELLELLAKQKKVSLAWVAALIAPDVGRLMRSSGVVPASFRPLRELQRRTQ